jgi:hypothetical protein
MIINSLEKVIQLKIVYYGPAMSGKTTTIKALFKHFGKEDELQSIESTVNRTLFFDYGAISFQNKNWKLKLNIYTTTGQDFYHITRPVVVKATDGLIFVADSCKKALKRNIQSWKELKKYFNKKILNEIPKIIALNKQDLKEKFSIPLFFREIDFDDYKNLSFKKTIALNGEGVLESFEEILRLILQESTKKPTIVKNN